MTGPSKELAGRAVLIVEDQYLVAQSMRRSVEALNGRVLGPVPNVDAALEILKAETPDLALLDVNLGQEKVFPAIAELNRRKIPFIFTTGYELQVLSPEYRAELHLEKPVTTRALAEAVAKLF